MTALLELLSSRWREVITFVLVFGRAAGLIVASPFWGSRTVPVVVRGWVAVLLAVATYPLVRTVALPQAITLGFLFLTLAGEIALGLVLGWFAQLLFAAVRLAGQQMEIKSGLGLIQLVDPHEGGQTGVFSTFLELLVGAVFFATNGHYWLIQALSSSYNVFPVGGEAFVTRVLEGLIGSTGEIFRIALRISAPVLVGLLLSDIVLGIVSRAVPQMNVFMIALPLQFCLGLLLLLLALPAVVGLFVEQVPRMMAVPGGAR